jgi:uncharacterized repeat protein (TIGR03837 family)
MLTVRVLPFVPQPDYDKLLWACDFNFVRGEDSFVRAQWARRPFVWHIYPQDEILHHKKLRAFLARYATGLDSLAEFSLAWNGAGGDIAWAPMLADMDKMAARCLQWEGEMVKIADMTGNLLRFASGLKAKNAKTAV